MNDAASTTTGTPPTTAGSESSDLTLEDEPVVSVHGSSCGRHRADWQRRCPVMPVLRAKAKGRPSRRTRRQGERAIFSF